MDRRSGEPLHAQVEAWVRGLLREASFAAGKLLPDEITLARRLNVSRGTVRAALTRLAQAGVLERRAGIGTRVASRSLESGILAWRSFTHEMASQGVVVRNFVLDYRRVPAPADAVKALNITPGTPVWRVRRVRGWDHLPVLHTASWFHPRLGLNGGEDFSRPLYETLAGASRVVPHHAGEEFLAIAAAAPMHRWLKVPRDTPLLLRRHTVFDAADRPFEFAEVHYVSERFALTLDLRREDA